MSGEPKKFHVSQLQPASNVKKPATNPDGFKYRNWERVDWRSQVEGQEADDAWVKGLLKGKIVEGTENYPTDYLQS